MTVRRSDLLLVVGSVVASGALVVADPAAGPAEWLFMSVLLTAASLTGRQVWDSYRTSRDERRKADALQRTPSADVAARAVAAERKRLSVDIEQRVRALLESVRGQAAQANRAADPRPALRAIQHSAQEAHTELRRQLGLLRPPPTDPADAPALDAPACPARQISLSRTTVVGTALVVLLAGVDLLTVRAEGVSYGVVSAVLTLILPLTLLGRRLALEAAALTASALLLIGAATGYHVQDGFAYAAVCVLFGWTLAAAGRWSAWAVLAVLAAADLISRQLNLPDNLPINAVLLTAAVLAGAAVGVSRRRRQAAAERARRRREELDAAAAEAVGRERRDVARELHDLVSHAVSVIAVQAGAAEVSWPEQPDATRRAIQVVADTAERAQQDLGRLMPHVPLDDAELDLGALVERMRQAGLTVQVQGAPEEFAALPASLRLTVFRVVQEGLTNVLRHSPRGRVRVDLARRAAPEGEELMVSVRDDGGGQTVVRRGFGLIGLTERVALAGGTLSAGPQQDAPGFALTAVLPMPATTVLR